MSSGAIPFTGSTEVLPDSDFMSTSLNEASKSSPASVSPDVHAESSDLIRSKKPLFLLLLLLLIGAGFIWDYAQDKRTDSLATKVGNSTEITELEDLESAQQEIQLLRNQLDEHEGRLSTSEANVTDLQASIDASGLDGAGGVQGPRGPTGAQGAQGPVGPAGATGDAFFSRSGNDAYFTSGNFGLGTSTPQAQLHVDGSIRFSDLVSCDTIDTDANGLLSCGVDATGAGGSLTGSGTANRLTMFTAGSVLGNAPFLLNGSTVQLDNAVNLQLLGGSATISGNLVVDTSSFYVDSATDRVGIGTASPSFTLDVIDTTGIGARIYRNDTDGQSSIRVSNTIQEWKFGLRVNEDFFIRDDTAGTIPFTIEEGALDDSLFVSSPGNVGIGTTTPQSKLTIGNGSLFVKGDSGALGVTAGEGVSLKLSTAGKAELFGYNYTTATASNLFLQAPGGKVVVGNLATPGSAGSQFNVVGNSSIGSSYATVAAPTNGLIVQGNVGIGSSSPASLLSVGATNQFQVNASGAIAAATGITSSGTITLSGLSNCDTIDTNASGVLSCGTDDSGSGAGYVDTTGTPASNQVAYFSDADTLQGSANFTFNSSTLAVTGNQTISANLTVDTDTFFVDSVNNRVGIGTTTPASTLEVYEGQLRVTRSSTTATSDTVQLYNPDPTDGNASVIAFRTLTTGTGSSNRALSYIRGITDIHDNATRSGSLSFDTSSGGGPIGRMVIQGNGNVGIGDTSPASLLTVGAGDAFQVNSSGAITAATGITSSGTVTLSGLNCTSFANGGAITANASGVLSCSDDDTGGGGGGGFTDDGAVVRLTTATDSVGLGTTNPQTNLHIFGSSAIATFQTGNNGSSYSDYIETDGGNAFGGASAWGFRVGYNGPANQFQLQSGSATTVTTRLVVDRDLGYVGIGDTSPAYLLTVGNGDLFGVNSSGNLLFEGTTVDANKFTIAAADPTANRTYTIPNSTATTDTFCLVSLANCGGGSGDITGTGATNQLAYFSAAKNIVSSSNLSYDGTTFALTGNAVFQPTANSTTAFRINNAGGGATPFNVDTTNQRVGIHTLSPLRSLDVRGDVLFRNQTNSTTAFTVQDAASASIFNVDTTNKSASVGSGFYANSSSNLVGIGTNNPSSQLRLSQNLSVVTSADYGGLAITNYSVTDVHNSFIDFNKSGSSTIGAQGLVANNESIGGIIFRASDGTAFQNAATINGEVDGVTGAGDTPGRLVFRTSLDGTSSPTERLRISNNGNVGIGDTSPASLLTVGAGDAFQVNGSGAVITTGITTSGNIIPNAASAVDLGSTNAEYRSLFVADNTGVNFGLGQDALLAYDEATDDRVELTGSGASLFIEDRLSLGTDGRNIANNFIIATPASLTINPLASFVQVSCADPDGCNITMGETTAKEGDIVIIINDANETLNFSDTTDITELSGAFAAGLYDSLTLIYEGNRWIELSRSNN